jgi:hypothetical protein
VDTDLLTAGDLAKLERSLLVGLARSPMPAPAALGGAEAPTLAMLALLGQRKRFRQPPPPPSLTRQPVLPPDPRPVVPDGARALLLQLLTGREANTWDLVARAVLDRLDDHGLRLHPFDLPKLGRYLKDMAGLRELGSSEAAWLALADSEAPRDPDPAEEEISEETWTVFPKARRLAFLELVRRDDPAKGRRMIEAAFAGDPAAVRADMVRVLKVGASDADSDFLERALGDRAGSVKEAAREVLGRIPGTEPYLARQAAALDAIRRKKAGVFSAKPRLSFKTARKRDPALLTLDVCKALDGVRLADVAAHLALAVEDVLAAAADDHALFFALLRNAACEGRWDLVCAQAGRADADWETVIGAANEALLGLPRDERRAVSREILSRAGLGMARSHETLGWLYDALGGPLDEDLADMLMAGAGWRALISKLRKAEGNEPELPIIAAVAALIPRARSERFLAALEPLPREAQHRASLFHRFLAALPAETEPTRGPRP